MKSPEQILEEGVRLRRKREEYRRMKEGPDMAVAPLRGVIMAAAEVRSAVAKARGIFAAGRGR